MSERVLSDPIIDEVRETRRRLYENVGDDLHALCELLRALPAREGFTVVRREPKRILDKTGS